MNSENIQEIKELMEIANCETNNVVERALALDSAYKAVIHYSHGVEDVNSSIEELCINNDSFVIWGAPRAKEMVLKMCEKTVTPNVIRGKSAAIMMALFPNLVKGESHE